MGMLAVRQGDVLFFARSLVWSVMYMDNIDDLDPIDRIRRFHLTITERERLLNRLVTQEEMDDLAAQCKVKTIDITTRNVSQKSATKTAESRPKKGTGGF